MFSIYWEIELGAYSPYLRKLIGMSPGEEVDRSRLYYYYSISRD